MNFNESWHFGVIFWLASVPVYSCPLWSIAWRLPHCRDMSERLQAETTRENHHIEQCKTWRGTDISMSTHPPTMCEKHSQLMQKHNSVTNKPVLQPSEVCPIFITCLRIVQVPSVCLGSKPCLVSLQAKRSLQRGTAPINPHAIPVFPC